MLQSTSIDAGCGWGTKGHVMEQDKSVEIKAVKIDLLEGIEVNRQDYLNEIVTLRTLLMGLKQLSTMVKCKEVAFANGGGDKIKVMSFGATSPKEQEFLDTVACFFHWFGISVCNYVRLVGFIRGLARGDFVRADLKDSTKFKQVKSSIDAYVVSVGEIEAVRVWRNKVFAHFAITDPYKDDNIATLDMSIIFPITFEGIYVVGGMTMTRKDASGTYVSDLPRWSLTEVFESLIPRYWPELSFQTGESPAPPAAPTEGDSES